MYIYIYVCVRVCVCERLHVSLPFPLSLAVLFALEEAVLVLGSVFAIGRAREMELKGYAEEVRKRVREYVSWHCHFISDHVSLQSQCHLSLPI